MLASSPEHTIQTAATAEALRARSAPGKYNGLIIAAAALTSILVCSGRPDYRGGKNKRRANGEGIYKRVGEKGGVYIGRGKS